MPARPSWRTTAALRAEPPDVDVADEILKQVAGTESAFPPAAQAKLARARGDLAVVRGDLAAAMEHWQRALEHDPKIAIKKRMDRVRKQLSTASASSRAR